ncbi:MAG: tetratricopeptide repeat protein [Planctomycetota bacterium]
MPLHYLTNRAENRNIENTYNAFNNTMFLITKALMQYLMIAAPLLFAANANVQDGGPSTRQAEDSEKRKLALEWNDKGIELKLAKKTAEAVVAFEKALELAPGDPIITKNLGAAWNDEGVARLNSDLNLDKAIAAFTESLKYLPGDATIAKNKAVGHDKRGYTYIQKKLYESALADFRTAMQLDPTAGRYPTSIAYISFCKEDFDGAELQLEAVVRKFEKEIDGWMLLGETCYRKGDLKRSLEAFEAAQKIDPKRSGLAEKLEKVRNEVSVEGEFVPQNTTHFQFHFPPKRKNLEREADLVAGILNDAFYTVGRALDYYPTSRTQVIFYEVKDFTSVTRADEWVGALYDGKIRVPLRDFDKQYESLKKTLFHEYTHRVVHGLARNECPTWVNEGLAQLFEGANATEAESRLREKPELLLNAKELKAPFVGKIASDRARVAYDQSLSVAKYLQDQRGSSAVARYLRALGGNDGKKVIESEVFESEFRMSLDELLIRWRLATNLPAEK